MENNNYKWKMELFAKKANINDVIKEFEKIQQNYGSLKTQFVVDTAKPEKSILHSFFEWNDSKAAELYRLQQARCLINNIEVVIISDSEIFNVPVYEIVTSKENGREYKHIETMSFDEIEQVKRTTIIAIQQLTKKLQLYKKFDKVIVCLQNAEKILQN